jgi:AcrR family transcriptional regulator
VLEATRALIAEGGYSAATIEAISARSGVAKTTIYRRWPNRATIVVDLLMRVATEAVPIPMGRDPQRALRTEMKGVAGVADELPGRLLRSLLGEAQRDPEVQAALVAGVFHPRSDASSRAIRRAQAAGVIREDIPPLLAVDLLFGPIFYRMLVQHQPLNDAYVAQVYKYVVEGLKAPAKAPAKVKVPPKAVAKAAAKPEGRS